VAGALFVIQADPSGLSISRPGEGCSRCNEAGWDCVAPHGLACCWCVANCTDCAGRAVTPGTPWANSPFGRDAPLSAEARAKSAAEPSTLGASTDINVERLYAQCVERVMVHMRANIPKNSSLLASDIQTMLPGVIDKAVATVRQRHAAGLTAAGYNAQRILFAHTAFFHACEPSTLGPIRAECGELVAARTEAFSIDLHADNPSRAKYQAKVRANPDDLDYVVEYMVLHIEVGFDLARPILANMYAESLQATFVGLMEGNLPEPYTATL
jgi:hypothetical protein